MKTLRNLFAAVVLLAAIIAVPTAQAQGPYYPGSQASLFPNYPFGPITYTATSQGAVTTPCAFVAGASQTPCQFGVSGVSNGLVQVTGVGLTTVTFAIQGSIDGGATWFALPFALGTGYTTLPLTYASTATATASALYTVNLAGITNVRFVTSGTFTATSVSIRLTATSNQGVR